MKKDKPEKNTVPVEEIYICIQNSGWLRTRWLARQVWRDLWRMLRDALLQGKSISLPGIGYLCVREAPPRKYFHPRLGRFMAPARPRVRFRAAAGLQEEMREAYERRMGERT